MKHDEISELLPWYINETLDEAEHARVAEKVAESEEYQAEIAELKMLQNAVISLDEEIPEPKRDPVATVLAQIKSSQAQERASKPKKLSWLDSLWQWRPLPLLAAAAAVFLAFILLNPFSTSPAPDSNQGGADRLAVVDSWISLRLNQRGTPRIVSAESDGAVYLKLLDVAVSAESLNARAETFRAVVTDPANDGASIAVIEDIAPANSLMLRIPVVDWRPGIYSIAIEARSGETLQKIGQTQFELKP